MSLDVAAAIVGLVGLAGLCLQGCQFLHNIFADVSEAPQIIQDAADEVFSVLFILENFRQILLDLQTSKQECQFQDPTLALAMCDGAVKRLTCFIAKYADITAPGNKSALKKKWKCFNNARRPKLKERVTRLQNAKLSLLGVQSNILLTINNSQSRQIQLQSLELVHVKQGSESAWQQHQTMSAVMIKEVTQNARKEMINNIQLQLSGALRLPSLLIDEPFCNESPMVVRIKYHTRREREVYRISELHTLRLINKEPLPCRWETSLPVLTHKIGPHAMKRVGRTSLAEGPDRRMRLSSPSRVGRRVLGSRTSVGRLTQAFDNIIDNARHKAPAVQKHLQELRSQSSLVLLAQTLEKIISGVYHEWLNDPAVVGNLRRQVISARMQLWEELVFSKFESSEVFLRQFSFDLADFRSQCDRIISHAIGLAERKHLGPVCWEECCLNLVQFPPVKTGLLEEVSEDSLYTDKTWYNPAAALE